MEPGRGRGPTNHQIFILLIVSALISITAAIALWQIQSNDDPDPAPSATLHRPS